MDKRIKRFKICDFRFYPYLAKVFERLPEEVREKTLNDMSFQILADEDMLTSSVLRYDFGNPVKLLIYLSSKILIEPEHHIIHTIAHEIAKYVLSIVESETDAREKDIEDLLTCWGFAKEAAAVRYDKAITQSEGYKTGYNWAKNQNKEYLIQHFGLYFNEWNERGLGRIPTKGLNKLNKHDETNSILENIVRQKEGKETEPTEDTTLEMLSLRKAMLAGVMVAVKELELKDSSAQ
ncbi:MAG: hypothetical protein PVI71_18590 [Desulfobacterales bacterium]|jgi:hypothetical protein